MKLRREFKPSTRVYSAVVSSERPKRVVRRRMPHWFRWVGVGAVILAVCVSLLWIPQIRVASVVVQGARIEDPQEIAAIGMRQLEGSYFYVVPRNSIFFYPAQAIQKEIEDTYARVRDVSVSYRSATSISIRLEERTPVATWCGEGSSCVFLDADGFAFARAPRFSGAVFFEIGATTTSPVLRSAPLSPEEFQSVLRLKEDLATMLHRSFPDLGIPVGVDIDSGSSLSFRIQYPTAESEWRAVVRRASSPIELLKNVELALDALRSDEKNKGKTLEYVDARLGQKLFSKFKAE